MNNRSSFELDNKGHTCYFCCWSLAL